MVELLPYACIGSLSAAGVFCARPGPVGNGGWRGSARRGNRCRIGTHDWRVPIPSSSSYNKKAQKSKSH